VFYLFFKRIFDIVFSLVALILLLPVFIVIAILIKIDSPGPIFFVQRRVGKGEKEFLFYKFRSMVHGADKMRDRLHHLNETQGPIFKIKRDPRTTKMGKFLRKSSMDELPQLLNVLKGEMSLVGPRPPLPEEVAKYTPHQLNRLTITPGITCLWQISGRSNISFYEWIELDIYYIQNRSFSLDLKILIRTIPVVLSCKGAY